MDVDLIGFYYNCNTELTSLLCTGIWHPKSRNCMLRKGNHEAHEPWLAPPDRHQASTRTRSAPDTHKVVSQNWGKETRWQQRPWRTKGAPRRAQSSRHAKGNGIMCSATGASHLHCSHSNRKETHPYNRWMGRVAHCGRARATFLKSLQYWGQIEVLSYVCNDAYKTHPKQSLSGQNSCFAACNPGHS